MREGRSRISLRSSGLHAGHHTFSAAFTRSGVNGTVRSRAPVAGETRVGNAVIRRPRFGVPLWIAGVTAVPNPVGLASCRPG